MEVAWNFPIDFESGPMREEGSSFRALIGPLDLSDGLI